jgi:hypothetical protein
MYVEICMYTCMCLAQSWILKKQHMTFLYAVYVPIKFVCIHVYAWLSSGFTKNNICPSYI